MENKDAVKLEIILEFEVIFSGEVPNALDEYFKGAPREKVLRLASFLLGFKNKNSKFRDNVQILSTIFGPENNAFANEVYAKIKAFEQTKGKTPVIIHPYTSLKLFEYFFSRQEDPAADAQTAAEFEVNFFKAYLALNSELTKSQEAIYPSIEDLDDDLKIPMMIFCMAYAYSDKVNYDIKQQWVTQTIKAILLFKFLESNDKTKHLFTEFLKFYGCNAWKDYMVRLIPLTLSPIKKEKETYTDIVVEKNETFDEQCDFIEKFIVDVHDELDEYDFLTLRSKPLYKVERGTYRIIYDLFLVEKIYKGLYFALKEINDVLPKNQQVKGLRSIYGDKFSEKTLANTILEIIYSETSVKFSGEELDKMKIDGAPDYYIRKLNNVLVFESKDFLIPKQAKQSFDYGVYDAEFEKKLYFTEDEQGNQKPKAVAQLIENVKKLLTGNFPADTKYKRCDINIYPILLLHDHQYDVPGFNKLINSWFQEELAVLAEEGLYIKKVKPLIIVNIDSLIYHQVALRDNIRLHQLINDYIDETTIGRNLKFNSEAEMHGYMLDRSQPFSVFITNYFAKRNLKKLPPMLEELGLQMFDKKRWNRMIQ